MARSWREWNREAGKRAVDAFLEGRPIPRYDREGRLISQRYEVTCPKCLHCGVADVPFGAAARFRCSKCGSSAEAQSLDPDEFTRPR